MEKYKTQNDACDIVDKRKLSEFRAKRNGWLIILNGDDIHSIWKQTASLIFNQAFFWTINEARRLASVNPTVDVGINADVLRLFDTGYALSQITTIRRLTEKPNPKPDKNVNSLRRLISEIKENRDVITREIYVCYDGLPYEYEATRARYYEEIFHSHSEGHYGIVQVGDGWFRSELIHKQFDKLSGVNEHGRNRNDVIQETIFDRLEKKLDICHDVRKHADKFIAHAADSESLKNLTEDQIRITYNALTKCNKAIIQVMEFIATFLIHAPASGSVPVPQHDLFKNLDKQWILSKTKGTLYDYWHKQKEEIEGWGKDVESIGFEDS